MKPKFFRKQSDLRDWFQKYHGTKKELLVGYYKTATGKPSVTWSQSVDEALCFGWIDGVRHSLGDESYCNRFTPRKASSIWSRINIAKAKALIKQGRMRPAGLAAFKKRDDKRSEVYSFEQKVPTQLNAKFLQEFKRNKSAWKHFSEMTPSYRKAAIHWVMSAKQDVTQLRRLATLIKESSAGNKVPPLRWASGKKK
jgi:uncharacterized protein YdeI (YjbR/CyaY-like superfamily)